MNDEQMMKISAALTDDKKNELILNKTKENKKMKLVLKEITTLLARYDSFEEFCDLETLSEKEERLYFNNFHEVYEEEIKQGGI